MDFWNTPKDEVEFPKDEENQSIWDDEGNLSRDLLIDVLTNKECTTIQVPFIKNLDLDYFTDEEASSEIILNIMKTIMRECYKWLFCYIVQ